MIFSSLGYSSFFLALSVLHIGRFLLKNFRSPDDMLKIYPRFTIKVVTELATVFLIASFFSVFQRYFLFESNSLLVNGAGGFIGDFIGGNLFYSIGLYGALTTLTLLLLVCLIVFGDLHLVGAVFALKQFFTTLKNNLLQVLNSFMSALFTQEVRDLFKREVKFVVESGVDISNSEMDVKGTVKVEDFALPPIPKNSTASVVEKQVNSREAIKKPANKKAKVDSDAVVAMDSRVSHGKKTGEISLTTYKKRYTFPSVDFLEMSDAQSAVKKQDLDQQCRDLEERLASFSLAGKIIDAHVGARLTMYEFQPAPGVRLSKLTSLSDDLALLLGADSIRILAPIPGKTTVGIEVPNKQPKMVKLGDMLKPLKKEAKNLKLPIVIGKDVYNNTIIEDIAKMPHMMVSGTTGSGKSVFINNLIVSLLYSRSPKQLRFLMIDPKMIELSPYNGIPHLLKPVVTDLDEAKDLLVWAQDEMDRRYQAFADIGARDLQSFNKLIADGDKKFYKRKNGSDITWKWEEQPQIVVIVDELADLMITKGKEVEVPITRIAQKARAAGIHLILATQRPSAEVVTGLIKTNFPTRVAFKVSSSIDSRTILDSSGAEKLLGNGDMLFMSNGKSIERFQSAFVSEEEVRKIVTSMS